MDFRQAYVDAILRYGEQDARVRQAINADYSTKCAVELDRWKAQGQILAIEWDAADTLLFVLRMAERHRLQALCAKLNEILGIAVIMERLDELRADVDELASVVAGGLK